MYAVIRSGGKQEKVEVGQHVAVELLGASEGETVRFTPILVVDGDRVLAAATELVDAVVSAVVVGETKGPKIRGFTYKPKTNQRRHYGHRQHYTEIEVTDITAAGASVS